MHEGQYTARVQVHLHITLSAVVHTHLCAGRLVDTEKNVYLIISYCFFHPLGLEVGLWNRWDSFEI